MAFTINEDGSQRKRKKGEPFSASLYTPRDTDRHYPYEGPGSLLDRNLKDYDKPMRGYPSDNDGSIPLVKKRKKKGSRTA